MPSLQPSAQPTIQPSTKPSFSPSAQPSNQPNIQPLSNPTVQPLCWPSIKPSSKPSHQPMQLPSQQPSAQPFSRPSIQPSIQPRDNPSSKPSVQPSSYPSIQPLTHPSFLPTALPSKQPSAQPVRQPSSQPTFQPTIRPASKPSINPSAQPIAYPSYQPTYQPKKEPSIQPSTQPLSQPSLLPSIQPRSRPSFQPSFAPSREPSVIPSIIPSSQPSLEPMKKPSREPSLQPSVQPWTNPSSQPLLQPTTQPLPVPSTVPTSDPSFQPSTVPSSSPSLQPFMQPTEIPSAFPSHHPSCQPSSRPSHYPSKQTWYSPSVQPSKKPSIQPNSGPSLKPSIQPVYQPISRPSQQPLGCLPSQQPSVKPSFRPLISPTVCPTGYPSLLPLKLPSSKPSSQPLLVMPTSQPQNKPSKQPSSQPLKRPRRKPSSQPSKAPSKQPTRQPHQRPSYQPSQSPTFCPLNFPSSQPNIQPTAQPTRQPSTSPTAKSKKPINLRVPTFLSTISPTRSILEELENQVQSAINNLTIASSSSNQKHSVYQQLEYGISQSTNCNSWAAFIQNDLVLLQSSYIPISISLKSIFQTIYSSSKFSHVTYVCEDSAAVKFLINTITSTPTSLGNGKITRTCSGNNWTVYSCSNDVNMPLSLCVNCINPCSPLDSYTTISPCSGNLTTTTKKDQLSNAQVLSIGLIALFQPPALKSVNITTSRSTIAVSATMSSAGEMACAVFLSTAAAPTSYDEILVQNYNSFSSSRNISYVLLTGLQAITQYKIYCFTSSYGVRTAMSTVADNYFFTSTKCCKYVSVYQSSSTLLEGINTLNFLSMKLSASPSDLITIHISLRQMVNETDSTSVSANFIPSNYQIFDSTSVSSLQLASSLPKIPAGSYSYSIHIGGVSASEYEAVYMSGQNPVFTVIAVDSVQPAPSLVEAIFSDDGSSFTLSFDSATNKGDTTNLFNCAKLFEFACAKQSQCQWLDSRHVNSFVFGSSSCASPGSTLRIAAPAAIKALCVGKCSSYSTWPNATRSAVIIGRPVAAVTPQVVLSVPAIVGSCDSLFIDISSSTGSGGRPWSAAKIQVRRSDNGNISLLQSYLNTTFIPSSPTLVPSALINRGFSYIFSVYLCNFLSMCNQASQVVVALETVVPTAYLPGQPIRTTTRNALVTIASVASVSVCTGENSKSFSLQYSWAISQNGVPLLGFSSISKDPSKLLLPPYSLSSNTFYTIRVTVTIKSSLKSAVASCILFVDVGKIVSMVSGGQSRNMKVLSSISIDASTSYDEDVKGVTGTAAGLLFDWSCVQIAPSLNDNCLNTLAWSTSDSSKSAVTFSSVASSAGSQSLVTVVVQDSSGSRKSSIVVTVTVVSADAPIVSSSSSAVNGVMNPGQTLQLFGKVIYPDFSLKTNAVVRWSVSDNSVNLTTISLTPVSVPLKAASSNVYLVISPSTLPVGSVLSFTLSCCGDMSLPLYSSSVTITINSPPRAGFFQIDPNPGIELQDNFLFNTGQWTDSDLPMRYQFGYISSLGATVITQSKSLKASGTSLLPAGPDSENNILGTFVVVFDSLNANSSLQYSVIVRHGSDQTNSLEMISTILSSFGNLSTASVDQVKQSNGLVTYLMSKVNCSSAPNCSELHRRECSSTPHTCGSCNSNLYIGESGDSNSKCVPVTSSVSLSSLETKCLSDFQCSGFQRCINNTCAVPQKNCISNCSGHGVCKFSNSNTGVAVSGCTIDDPNWCMRVNVFRESILRLEQQ